jgi:hypothetical protein
MDPKPDKMTIRCGICHINTKNTKHMYRITGALKQENPRIQSADVEISFYFDLYHSVKHFKCHYVNDKSEL